jgi:flavin reductase (DIM6/NTAB) family NADH-FMN oxidoreductase RutF
MNLIGTKSKDGQTNLAIFNSVVHIGANPPLIGFIQRPTTVERHTFENIVSTSFYTINAVTEEIAMQAHQTAANYQRKESEFEETSLETEYLNDFYAPFVAASPIKYGLQLEDVIPIPANDTKLVIGNVQQLHLQENSISEDGHLKLEASSIVGGIGLDTYVSVEKYGRYSYAQPNKTLKKL